MKYINNWELFKLNENKDKKQTIIVTKTNLSKIIDKLNKEYTNLKLNLYLITEDDNENRVNVIIDDIDFNPLSNEYKKSLIDNDRTVKYNFDNMYTDEFKDLINEIKNKISEFGLIFKNVMLTNKLKNKLL